MKKYLVFLIFFLILFCIVFRDLLLNINSNLIDWFDYPVVTWVINQDITKLISLNFNNFFDTNIYYPHKYTLLFADILLPQAIFGLLFFVFTKNPILTLNISFILTFILNFTSTYIFWKRIFNNNLVAFLGSLFFIFSPFFYLELGHFQMLSYWPFFFTLYFLFKQEEKYDLQKSILIGLGITIQFLASVYLSVFLIFSILIYYLVKFAPPKHPKVILYKLFIIFFIFFLTSGVFVKGYIDMRNTYHVKRDMKEYITNSADLSDYLFTGSISSIIHKSSIMKSWNKLNNTGTGLFPGFLITTLAVFALFKIHKAKQSIFISLELSRQKVYFLILIIIGLIFSFGPRLSFNGNYANIPLPYNLLLKYIPLLEAIRVVIRWSFLFFFGLTYFSLISLNRLANKSYYKISFLLVFTIFVLEYIPFDLQTTKNTYITPDYQTLKDMCSKDKRVLIELPLTHLNAAPNIREGLKYIATLELSSTYHQCNLINGYSGYDLPENFILANNLDEYIKNQQPSEFIAELKKRNINFLKINQQYFIKEVKPFVNTFKNVLTTQSGVEKISPNLFRINIQYKQ